jgi:ABC-type uncharacterized transport system involved in gliding motility auxiliary subunit
MMASRSSDLNKIISAWGLTVNTDDVIGDDRFALTVTGFGARPTRHIGLISVDEFGIGADDIVTSGLSSLNFGYAGHIAVEDDAAVSISPLVQSSDLAGLVPTADLAFLRDPSTLLDGFTPTGTRYLIAARIQGTVPSAFPDGSPSATEDAADDGHLAESVSPINVVIVADTDVLTDRMWAQTQNFFGQPVTTAFAGNGDLVGNILDNLSGSGDLISIRGRATYTRPFTKVQDLRREAESTFRMTEQRLQQELQAAESKLSELQANREDTNAFIMTEEQEATLESFQNERLRIRKELRQVQRNLDQDIEDLGTWLKIINIGSVPVLITVLSIFVLAVRRQRRTGS